MQRKKGKKRKAGRRKNDNVIEIESKWNKEMNSSERKIDKESGRKEMKNKKLVI